MNGKHRIRVTGNANRRCDRTERAPGETRLPDGRQVSQTFGDPSMSGRRRATFSLSGRTALITLCCMADGPVEKVADQPIEL
jgi:hypothetical protein